MTRLGLDFVLDNRNLEEIGRVDDSRLPCQTRHLSYTSRYVSPRKFAGLIEDVALMVN